MNTMKTLFANNIVYSPTGLVLKEGKLEEFNLRKIVVTEGLVEPLILNLPPDGFGDWGKKVLNLFCKIEPDYDQYLIIYLMDRVGSRYIYCDEELNKAPYIKDRVPTKFNGVYIKVGMLNPYLMLRIMAESNGIVHPRSIFIPKGFNHFTPGYERKESISNLVDVEIVNSRRVVRSKPKSKNTKYLNEYNKYLASMAASLEKPVEYKIVTKKEFIDGKIFSESKDVRDVKTGLSLLDKPKRFVSNEEVKKEIKQESQCQWTLFIKYIDPLGRKQEDLSIAKKFKSLQECEADFKRFKSQKRFVIKESKAIKSTDNSVYKLV